MPTTRKAITSGRAPGGIGPYSHAVEAGGLVFCSGQLGIDPTTDKLAGDVEEQTDQALTNIEEVLREVGLSLDDVVKTTVFMTSVDYFPRINSRYVQRFSNPMPARSAPTVADLPRGAALAIEAIASMRPARDSG